MGAKCQQTLLKIASKKIFHEFNEFSSERQTGVVGETLHIELHIMIIISSS